MGMRDGARRAAPPRTRRACRRRDGRAAHDESGVAAVEFAIIAPLLLMMVFGVMAFGLALAQSAALAGGAREGARFAAVNVVAAGQVDHECTDVITKARTQAAQTIGVAEIDVAVTVERIPSGDTGSACSVAAGVATPVSTAPDGVGPCTKATADDTDEASVKVTTTLLDRAFVIPVPGGSMLTPDTLTRTAEYRCEYH